MGADRTKADLIIDHDAAMLTRDGVRLSATVYRLADADAAPVLLMRTPYGKDIATAIHVIEPAAAARAGFVVIIQDVRGRYASEGTWRPYETDAEDGYDAVQWAASLPFCDGAVGMYGASYQGAALLAAAALRPPALKAIAPMLCWRDPEQGQTFRGGALELGKLLRWTLMNMPNRLERAIGDPKRASELVAAAQADLMALDAKAYAALPLSELPVLKAYDPNSEVFDYIRAGDAGDRQVPAMIPPGRRHDVPALWIAGWFDAFLGNMLNEYQSDRGLGLASELIVVPWTHAVHTGRAGAVDFGPLAQRIGADQQSVEQVLLTWFADILKGRREPKPIQMFAMGENRWRALDAFPAADAPALALYLATEGGLAEAPIEDAVLAFTYDPGDPAPSVGGPTLMGGFFPAGPSDQKPLSARPDMLLFQGPLLQSAVTIQDWLTAELWVESSAACTDFVARLVDIGPDGRQIGVTDGIARVNLDPLAGPRNVAIDLWATHHTFAPGHRIGVQVTSSSFPRWNRNLNSGEPLATGETIVVARQGLHVGPRYPSRLRTGRPDGAA